MLFTDSDVLHFIQCGYVTIPWETAGIMQLAKTFESITALPIEEKRQFLADERLGHDCGLTDYITFPEKDKDAKRYMHVGRQLLPLLDSRGVVCNDQQTAFMHAAQDMHHRLLALHQSFLSAVADVFCSMGDCALQTVLKSTREIGVDSVFRFMEYGECFVDGVPVGHKHTDKNAITIHVVSNGPLLLWDMQGNEVLHRPAQDRVMLFASDKLQLAMGGHLVRGKLQDDVLSKHIRGGAIRGIAHQPLAGSCEWADIISGRRFAGVFFGH